VLAPSELAALLPPAHCRRQSRQADSLSAQVQKSYGFDKVKADAEVRAFMGARTF
jgi:hypothetical protein